MVKLLRAKVKKKKRCSSPVFHLFTHSWNLSLAPNSSQTLLDIGDVTVSKRQLLFNCEVVSDSATPWTAACQASLSFTISQSLLKLMSIELVMPSNHLILCHPLLLLPSIFPSIRVFPSELALYIRWSKCWSFSLSISPSSEYSGLISFRTDWLDLLDVRWTLKSLLQQCNSKA